MPSATKTIRPIRQLGNKELKLQFVNFITLLALLSLINSCSSPGVKLSQSNYGFNCVKTSLVATPTLAQSDATIAEESVTYINPKDYKSWAETGISTGQGTFQLAPGDYRPWGKLVIRPGKRSDLPLVIQGSKPDIHPVQITQRQRVIIEGFELRGKYSHPEGHPERRIIEVENVQLSGLYISGRSKSITKQRDSPDFGKVSGPTNIIQFAQNISVRRCVIEHVSRKNAIRVQARYVSIEECVIRNCRRLPEADNIGISVTCGKGYLQEGIVIRNNEIYNCTDGIQFVVSSMATAGSAPGALVEGNDIYLTPEYYLSQNGNTYAAAENGIDLKTGGTAEAPMVIRNNFIRGMRPTWKQAGGTGSNGVAIGMLNAANHIIFTNNIITDCPMAFKFGSKLPQVTQSKKANVRIENNLVYQLFKDGASAGTVIRSDVGLVIAHNTFVETAAVIQAGYTTPMQLNNNLFVAISEGHIWSKNHRWQMDNNLWVNPPQQLEPNQATVGESLKSEQTTNDFQPFSVTIQPLTAPKQLQISYGNFRPR